MDLEGNRTQVYACPRCKTDTPHRVLTRNGGLYGIDCNLCHTGSIVPRDELLFYQARWEEEVRAILVRLEDPEYDRD